VPRWTLSVLITEDRQPLNCRRRDKVDQENSSGALVQRKLPDAGSGLRPLDVNERWARLEVKTFRTPIQPERLGDAAASCKQKRD